MPNCTPQARERALKVLRETDNYVSGFDEDVKKLLYRLIEQVKYALAEVNRAVGEMDNILPQYNDTSAKMRYWNCAVCQKKENFFARQG